MESDKQTCMLLRSAWNLSVDLDVQLVIRSLDFLDITSQAIK